MTELIIPIPILHKRFFWRIQTIMTSHTWYRSQNYTLSLRKFVAAMSIMQNNGGFVYNTHLNNKIEEVVMGFPVFPTRMVSIFDEKSQWLFSTIFFQIREWMIHFKSGLAVAQVMVGDLLFRNRNVIDCDCFKILEIKNVKRLE